MSFYATIQGYVRYRSKEALDRALTYLRENRWMNEQNVFTDESGRPMTAESTLRGMTLEIPNAWYRNLASHLERIGEGADYKIAWSSTDGVWAAGVIINGKSKNYDLEKWAPEHYGPPDEDEDHIDYLNEAEASFAEWAYEEFDFASLAPPR